MKRKFHMFLILALTLMWLILPQALCLGATTSQISQYGITWTFDKEYEYGQFANGDYWVLGPVNITNITPGWDGEKHGSMVNPTVSGGQAYDTRLPGYFNSSALVQAPVTLNPNSSLISVISWVVGEPSCPPLVGGRPRPTLKAAAVLTVLDSIPPDNGANVFRPPYAGNDKPLYLTSNLRKELLPNLFLVANTPNIQDIARRFERVWLDHFDNGGGDGTQYTSPSENMPNYGREYSNLVGDASLLLMLDEQELVRQQGANKDLLLMRLVQLGIDLYHIAKEGKSWSEGGGLNHGRKWPIIFTGFMLDNEDMKNVDSLPNTFQEDLQTWYLTQQDVGREMYTGDGKPRGTYFQVDVGMPEWGEQHTRQPERDGRAWAAAYREIVSKSIPGEILAAHIMGAKDLWNHNALFDYIDRSFYVYLGEGGTGAYSTFTNNMWLAYRQNYPPVWTMSPEITITINGAGIVAKTPDKSTYELGEYVTLEAIPALGCTFTSWGGAAVWPYIATWPWDPDAPIQNPLTILMYAHQPVIAIFALVDSTFPVADAGPDQTIIDKDKDGSEQVTLDGFASYDPDGTIVSFVWTEGAIQIATGVNPTVTLSLGTHVITLTVTDNGGLTNTDAVTIKVLKRKKFGGLPTGCYNNVINPSKAEEATIIVELEERGYIKIDLYDMKGKKIKELVDEEKEADVYKYYWDGKDDSGNVVGSGLYFVHIQAGNYKKIKKIVVVK